MMEDFDQESFRLDPGANSFQLKGFRWRDAPIFIVCMVLTISILTGFNFVAAVGLSFLGANAALFICGISLGFLAGVWVGEARATAHGSASARVDRANLPPLSDHVKEIASVPSRKIEAIKAYREESGARLADAKQAVEAYINNPDR